MKADRQNLNYIGADKAYTELQTWNKLLKEKKSLVSHPKCSFETLVTVPTVWSRTNFKLSATCRQLHVVHA